MVLNCWMDGWWVCCMVGGWVGCGWFGWLVVVWWVDGCTCRVSEWKGWWVEGLDGGEWIGWLVVSLLWVEWLLGKWIRPRVLADQLVGWYFCWLVFGWVGYIFGWSIDLWVCWLILVLVCWPIGWYTLEFRLQGTKTKYDTRVLSSTASANNITPFCSCLITIWRHQVLFSPFMS